MNRTRAPSGAHFPIQLLGRQRKLVLAAAMIAHQRHDLEAGRQGALGNAPHDTEERFRRQRHRSREAHVPGPRDRVACDGVGRIG